MLLREAIVQEALTWRDTPYHNAAALKGVGCDCAGLVIGIAKALALLPLDWQPLYYSPDWHLHRNEELLLQTLHDLRFPVVSAVARQPGDILLMQYGRVCSHTAILVACNPPYIIHAARDYGRVVHQRLDTTLAARVRSCYTFPGGALCD